VEVAGERLTGSMGLRVQGSSEYIIYTPFDPVRFVAHRVSTRLFA
jgi:hypothetical protein